MNQNNEKYNHNNKEGGDSSNPQSSRRNQGIDGVMNHHSDMIPEDLEGHVIICGASNGLKDLVQQIRQNHSNVLISNGCILSILRCVLPRCQAQHPNHSQLLAHISPAS